MAGSSVVGAATSIGQLIGRYFSVVALLPATLLVGWLELLRGVGALTDTPSTDNLSAWFSSWTWGRLITLIAIAYVLGLVMHGVQFNSTQLLEGYWGTGRFAQALMTARTLHHRRRATYLRELSGKSRTDLDRRIGELPQRLRDPQGPRISDAEGKRRTALVNAVLDSERGNPLIRLWLREQEALRKAGEYPSPGRYIMPTRLGNALRRFERAAGRDYGLDAIAVSSRLHLAAPESHQRYLSDAREQLDLNVRLCTVGLLATAATVAVLATNGLWLFAALIPWGFAYFTYRGSITSADEYGEIFSAVLDLDRFHVYESLRLTLPRDSVEERRNNEQMSKSLRIKTNTRIGYLHPGSDNATS